MHAASPQKSARSQRDKAALGLHSFAMPLVIEAIEEIGPPSAIALVPRKAQRGPLLVTLATELCSILVSMLHEQLSCGRCLADSEDRVALSLGRNT